MSLQKTLAERLWNAQATGAPCRALTDTNPDLAIADAYAIQEFNLERRMNEGGLQGRKARLVGRKIGITSEAVQSWLNCSEPDFGGLLDDMAVGDGERADISRLLQPRVEGEIAFILKKCLMGPGITAAHVVAATECILPAIEIIDSRIIDWKFRLADTIADNASSGMFVLGTRPMLLNDADLRLMGMTLRKNGTVVSTGAGAACLGNPVNAVVWLANKLGEFGQQLGTGQVILSGALGPVSPVAAGDHVTVEIGRMGTISVGF